MNRREFIQLAGTGALTVLLSGCGLGALAGEKDSKEAKELLHGKKSIMMATAYNSADWTMEALENHYETLVRYMEWEDVGQVWATGCGARSLVEKSSFADMAYKIGANL
ncbi:hypothetical protein [Selenomonas ruminantium]|uniref:hypothetical protein n=1 Tax=Selenomonas ruminantium TaxID=971 RepID=UPI0026F364C2|nr:hypothetical protein [Selenomonas ruminantium]